MKKIISTLFIGTTIIGLKAQQVQYTVLKDDPNDVKPLTIALDILSADTWGTNSMMGYGIRAAYTYKGIGSVQLDYRKAYLDLEYKDVPNAKKHRAFELGVSYNLFGREKTGDISVVLASEMFFYPKGAFSQKISYLNVQGTKKWNLQLRGGLANFNVPFNYHYEKDQNKEDPRALSIVKDTVILPVGEGEGYSIGSGVPTLVTGIKGMMKLTTFYVGLSSRSIRNMWISTQSEGVCANTNEYTFFADALLLGGMSIADGWIPHRYYNDVTGLTQSNGWELDVDKSKLKKMGWRVGFEAKKHQNLAMTYKFEFGARPGLQGKPGMIGNNAYMLITAGFSFGLGKQVSPKK